MKKQFLVLFTLLLIPIALVAQTNISGTISNNTTLTAANSPYIVTGHINVNAGVTLTVESGVEMRFNAGIYMQVFGSLIANSATFTANGSTSKGFWPGIYVSYDAYPDYGNVTLNNCVVEYAQTLHVRKGELTLTNNTLINNFSSYGVDVYTAGTLIIDATTIQNCTYPVYFRDRSGNGNWTIGEGVILTGNVNDYVFIDFRDVISEFTLSDVGIPYYYNSELRITESGVLLLDPNVSLLGNTGAYISVNGKLKANGTPGEPVIFSNEPASNYWQGINFNDLAVDTACLLSNCQFTGANYVNGNSRINELSRAAIEIIKSSPTFNACEFSNNRYNLVVTGSSSPSFTDCDFMESSYVAKQTLNINIDLNATPEFNNCSLEFNISQARAIGIIGSTVYDAGHLMHQSFTGMDSLTYTLYGNVIVQDTASLLIDQGIVIKCSSNDNYIQANGTLTGIGTESSPIVFTHIADDNYGKPTDTFNDGTTTIARSSSGRLILNSQLTSTLDNWKILYAGLNSSDYAVYVYYGNVLKNCEINDSYRGILFSGDAQLLNNSLDNITNYPFSRRMNTGAPVLIGNTISNSGNLGIYVYDFMAGTYNINGLDIGSNTNVAYIVDKNTTIPSTADASILPGTVFKFTGGGKLSVQGGLQAVGTKNSKVIFSSIYDNSASGNTNFNTGADPIGHKWNGIEFYDGSNDNLNELKNCEVRYVNNSIRMTNCKVVLDSLLLNFSNNYAVSIFGNANPVITNCEFNNLSMAPIHMDMFANPTFSGNSIANVSQIGISINGGTISGTVPMRSFAGYDNITYLIYQTMRIDDQLDIPAGITFKCNGSAYWNIYGTFNVQGTAENPVIFTSLHDDAYGNPMDTEQNGQGPISKYGNRIIFRDQSDDNSLINNAVMRYSYDYAIYTASASPVISNSTFFNTNSCGLYLVGTSTPTVESCIFDDLQFPIITSLLTYPGVHNGNILSGTTAKGILIIDNETLTENFTLPVRSFAGIDNIPYIFDRFIVGTSAVLTISPGVVCKFRQNGYINVRNGLIADGGSTPDSTIVFTANRDDFYGGDTYNDGEANVANDYWWNGIYFPEESIDASCFLDNCVIKHGSNNYSSGANINNSGGLTLNNSSPTIQNCLFEHNYRAIIVRNTSLPFISNCDFVETNPTYGYGIWNETGVVTVVAENCWWNDLSGPYHPTLNPDGLGERVSDGVDFTPWITQTAQPILGDVSLNGEVMPYDASLVLQHTVGNITLDAKQSVVADVSDNGTISSFDASLILQYTIGLITNFEQTAKKSGTIPGDVSISAPSTFQAETTSRFQIPLSISTSATVKSIDMQFASNKDHLKFIGLNNEKMPSDILFAYGYEEDSGILKIAITSAHDLNLTLDELGLIFEIKTTQIADSELELLRLTANETLLDEAKFTTLVNSRDIASGIPSASALSSLNIYGIDEILIAELNLLTKQSNLTVSVYDIGGRLTNKINIENPEIGTHKFSFSADANGEGITGNLYIVTIRGDDFVVTRRLVFR